MGRGSNCLNFESKHGHSQPDGKFLHTLLFIEKPNAMIYE